jgi:hypothetical protein
VETSGHGEKRITKKVGIEVTFAKLNSKNTIGLEVTLSSYQKIFDCWCYMEWNLLSALRIVEFIK